ncbi:MAG: hypothetical protein H7259_03575, partial [Cytophagales bacterium]|nr:hypothetical protein [Cytophaga sp.]
YKYNNYYDLAVAVGKDELLAAASWSHLYGIGHKKQKFKIGYGLRFTSFYGYSEGKLYTTAPSKYTSPEQGPTTIFSENIDGNIDTLSISNPQVNSLNASIHLQYSITKKIDIGFNIDAIGFSFGTTKNGSVISSVYDPGQAYVQPARPTAFNLLLTSDNDFGSLNSEFYLRYWLTGHLGIRAGYTFYFSEYTTVNTLSFDNGQIQNDRYRLKSSLLMLAITYRPFVKH